MGLARPTSMTSVGRENSISAAEAPARPFKVSIVAVTWMLAGLPAEASSTRASA